MNKKVLIITYYWPPAGGPGVQRVLKFAKYLPEFGWEPIILTVENGDYHATDESLLKDVPQNLKVHKIKAFSVLDLYKKILGRKKAISSFELTKSEGGLKFKIIKWIRANLFIPDARGGWKRAAVKRGLRIIREEKPEIIFTSSPPHSLQLIGLKLKRKTGVKWVADFRDPWTDAFWDKELPRLKIIQKLNLSIEKRVIGNADELITISNGCAQLLSKDSGKKFKLLFNGYDDLDFNGIIKSGSNKFRINYVGSISSKQNPINFFKSIQALPLETKELLEVNFYGSFDSEVIMKSRENGNYTRFHSYISHDMAIKKMVDSEILLILIPENSKGIITGKLFEYLATKNFILGIAPENNEIESLLTECSIGQVFGYNHDLTDVLNERISQWKKGKENLVNIDAIKKYSRRQITGDLSKTLNKVSLHE